MVSRDTRRLVAFLPVHEKRGYRRLSLGLPHFYVAHPRRLSLVARFVLHSLTAAVLKRSGELLAESFAIVLALLGDPGFEKEATATGFGIDFVGRKNKPICCRFGTVRARRAQHFIHVVDGYGGVESGLAVG